MLSSIFISYKIICTQLFGFKYSDLILIIYALAQSAGAVEYTDCFSAER